MNPATSTSIVLGLGLFAIKTIYELVIMLKAQFAGKPIQAAFCNFPINGSHCSFASGDIHKLRTMEIVEGVARELGPALETQNRLLVEIRDGVRDMKSNRRH